MLDLLIGHRARCEKCSSETDCARVDFWDGSFSGLICWDDLRTMVAEKSKDPEARKAFAQMRSFSAGESHSEGTTHTDDKGHTQTRTVTRIWSRGTSRSEPNTETQGDHP